MKIHEFSLMAKPIIPKDIQKKLEDKEQSKKLAAALSSLERYKFVDRIQKTEGIDLSYTLSIGNEAGIHLCIHNIFIDTFPEKCDDGCLEKINDTIISIFNIYGEILELKKIEFTGNIRFRFLTDKNRIDLTKYLNFNKFNTINKAIIPAGFRFIIDNKSIIFDTHETNLSISISTEFKKEINFPTDPKRTSVIKDLLEENKRLVADLFQKIKNDEKD